MHVITPRTKMPELYRHPHAYQVRQHLIDMLKILAGKGQRGQTYLRDALTEARGAPLQVSSVEYGTPQEKREHRMIVPVRTRLTVVSHNPPEDAYDGRRMYKAEHAIERLDEFYFRHIDEHYLHHDMRPLPMFRDVMTDVFTVINKLNQYCLFHVRSLQNSTLKNITNETQLLNLLRNDIAGVRCVLRDEYLIDERYDFKAEIQLICPSAALAMAAQRSKKGNAP